MLSPVPFTVKVWDPSGAFLGIVMVATDLPEPGAGIGFTLKVAVIATVVAAVLGLLGKPRSLIQFVKDRPGHDRRYAIDPTKIERELGWRPQTAWSDGLAKTVRWYLDHQDWLARARGGAYLERQP